MHTQGFDKWLWTLVLLLLATACGDDGTETLERQPVLEVYVYTPERPSATRAVVDPRSGEAKVYSLRIWVYRHSNSDQLGALDLSAAQLDSLNEREQGHYSLALPQWFAANPVPIDVYVLGNVSAENSGTAYSGTMTDKTAFDEAMFNGGYYYRFADVNYGYKAVSELSGEGLPMSGVARNKSVTSTNNVFHITEANLRLVRAVSKIRFVCSSMTDADGSYGKLYIDQVTLDGGQFYTREYLFPTDDNPFFRVGDSPITTETVLYSGSTAAVNTNDSPADYAYKSGEDEAAYMERIDKGIDAGKVTMAPEVYLPESDKQLKGRIKYHLEYDSGTKSDQREASFQMSAGDFHRNQTWVVYAYYTGSKELVVSSVKVFDWQAGETGSRDVYNW